MEEKKELLIKNVKYAVQKYGMEGVTVRNISDVCGVNDSHLHRFYKNKEELLLEAYERENDIIFDKIYQFLDETKGIPLEYRSCTRLFFHRLWNELLSDPARLSFCIAYYHSSCFSMAKSYHNDQIDKLYERVKNHFKDKDSCVRAMYSVLTLLFDSTKRYADRQTECSPEEEELEFMSFYALLKSYIIDENLDN